MATYALYYHPNPAMVHNGANAYPTTEPSHPTLQLHTSKSIVPRPTGTEQSPRSALLDAQRQSVPSGIGSLPCPTSNQEASPFFRLPAELRNQIYTELLCPDAVNLDHLTKCKDNLSVRHYNQTSTILSTCRKTHDEATPLLYAPHIFHAHPALLTSLPHLTSSAKPVLHPRVADLISRWQICLRLDTDPQFTAAQAAAAFSGAEYLEVRVWQAQFEACDFAVLKLFTGVRGVRFARVGGDAEARLARWLEGQMMLPRGEGVWQRGGGTWQSDDACLWEGVGEVLCGRCYDKVSSLGKGAMRLQEVVR
ncbi:hypothetical protein PMIN01_09640 [Paraphaeosphaeria minitans]|uniref:2EXR domain-containing protein n=1 Tax=Paraphaeosphaeria minitans TaxID=565426 RepID=A0A9P6GBR7_9PLEO|nr:hypothetical protein PMIN01_09640 [Paraphaeosphaeria minitans]